MREIKITEIEKFNIGNYTDLEGGTGATVVIAKEGAVPGVCVKGAGPATRETDALKSGNVVDKIHAVCLSGGSAFGLEASTGVMTYLKEKHIGFDVGVGVVPIVTGACLFDLVVGSADAHPDSKAGYEACLSAEKNNYRDGSVGAGTGATVGKFLGPKYMVKSGIGSYAVEINGLKLGAITAVNALGDVYEDGKILAGILNEERSGFRSTYEEMLKKFSNDENLFRGNTTLSVVLTNAKLNKLQANRVAEISHNGFARTIFPVHTTVDGDTIFVMSTDEVEVNLDALCALSTEVVSKSIIRAIKNADTLHGVPAIKDIK